jgi:hypothetical protein
LTTTSFYIEKGRGSLVRVRQEGKIGKKEWKIERARRTTNDTKHESHRHENRINRRKRKRERKCSERSNEREAWTMRERGGMQGRGDNQSSPPPLLPKKKRKIKKRRKSKK